MSRRVLVLRSKQADKVDHPLYELVKSASAASNEAFAESLNRVRAVAHVLDGRRTPLDGIIPDDVGCYAFHANAGIKMFSAMAPDIIATTRLAVFSPLTGAMVPFDATAHCHITQINGSGPDASWVNSARKYYDSICPLLADEDSRIWNVPVVAGLDTSSDWTQMTWIVAFDRTEWAWLQDQLPPCKLNRLYDATSDDIPMRFAYLLYKRGLCGRYDAVYPVKRCMVRVWAGTPSDAVDPMGDGNTCSACRKKKGPGVTMRTCSACKLAKYCCKECQRADWPHHKLICELSKTYGIKILDDTEGAAAVSSVMMHPSSPTVPRCYACHSEYASMLRCSACKHAHYCDAECQRRDWPAHKAVCMCRQITAELR